MECLGFICKIVGMFIVIGVVSGFCLVQAFMPINDKVPTIKCAVIWVVVLMACNTCVLLFAGHNITFPL